MIIIFVAVHSAYCDCGTVRATRATRTLAVSRAPHAAHTQAQPELALHGCEGCFLRTHRSSVQAPSQQLPQTTYPHNFTRSTDSSGLLSMAEGALNNTLRESS